MDTLLYFSNLQSFAQDGAPLLTDCTGELRANDRVALVGSIGSGKSVLLLCLARLMPCAGEMFLRGARADSVRVDAWRSQVTLLTQTPALTEGTVQDNLKLPFTFARHKGRRFDPAWHLKKLRRFGKTADFLDKPIAHLSGGEKQIAHFLRALQFNPSVFLLDEPTAALDDDSACAFIDLLREWQAQSGGAYIWISHHNETAGQQDVRRWRLCDRRLICDKDTP